MSGRRFLAAMFVLLAPCWSQVSVAQLPLPLTSAAGQTVTPVFEGWYVNPDGTRSIVFGYYNRNLSEVLEIPVGPDNFMAPGPTNQGQPTHFQPHMHMRGKAMSIEAIYPDGHNELLSQVNNFQWNWHINYVYEEHVAPLLPKGTTVVVTAWHDNTAANPNNPDPEQWVGWGDRTVDEMAHAWVDLTYLEQEDFDAQVAARATKD